AVYSPNSNVKYSVAIPPATASAGTGDIFFQISAPSSYQWAGMGIGAQMAGATIFVMYTDGKGNVTISGREGGIGHVEPQYNSSIDLQLLAGSGVVGNTMVANVKCSNCPLSDPTSAKSPWIAAFNTEGALNSADVQANIDMHGLNDMHQITIDLTQAAVSSSVNPFVSSSSSPSASAAPPSATGGGSSDQINRYRKAHGILMAITVVVLMPFAALFIRTIGGVWVHAVFQIFNLCCLLAGLGLGIKLANLLGYLWIRKHTTFGAVIVFCFLVQPLFGLIHHSQYKKIQRRGIFSHIHIWYGRILIILAIVNGGLGLQLAAEGNGGKIAYSVVAGVLGLVYFSVLVIVALRTRKGEQKEKSNSP
ncbi:integral membrane protein-like protein, partial [Xylogone sp. PMI_703]